MEICANICRKSTEESLPDVVITIGEHKFFLHKCRLVDNSTYLRELIEEQSDALCVINLSGLPGGAPIFKIIRRFLYGEELELTSSDVLPVVCAAHYLDMTSHNEGTDIISEAEKFISKKVFPNWKDCIEVVLSSEEVSNRCVELYDILSRCFESLAYKVVYSNSSYSEDWWFDDACLLNLSQFRRLVQILDALGHDPVNISNSIIHYAHQYNPGLDPKSSGIWSVEERILLEEMTELLPAQKGATCTDYLLSMLSAGILLDADIKCIHKLERNIGAQLDVDSLDILLATCYKDKQDAEFSISCVIRLIKHFVDENADQVHKIAAVGRVVDEYLAAVATKYFLNIEEFITLARAIPDEARLSHETLYQAVCSYIEYCTWLSDQEKNRLCQLLNIQKISRETCKDAILNMEQLPVEFIFKVMFSEIVNIGFSLEKSQKTMEQRRSKLILMANIFKYEKEWLLSSKKRRKERRLRRPFHH